MIFFSQEWLTLDKCRHSVICRGLVRIRCLIDLERIITFLTSKGVINAGILVHPPPSVFITKVRRNYVSNSFACQTPF